MTIGSYLMLMCSLTVLGGFCWAQDNIDPFEQLDQPVIKPEIPDRGIETLPQAVTHERLENNIHQYSISGLFPLKKEDDLEGIESHCESLFAFVLAEGTKVEAELKGETIIFRIGGQIEYDTLAFVIDGLASGGVIPTWIELEARSLKQSEQFDLAHYKIEKMGNAFPPGLAWVGVSQYEELRMPFANALGDLGMLLIGATAGHCMCHSTYTIRVLDEKGDVIWKASKPINGNLQIATADTNSDHIHELYFETDDHGVTTRYILKPKIK